MNFVDYLFENLQDQDKESILSRDERLPTGISSHRLMLSPVIWRILAGKRVSFTL